MRKIKKALSLILVLSMILGMSLNVGAADVTTKAQTEQTAGQDKASVENKDADEPSATDADASADTDAADADKATESKAVKKAEVSTDKAATADAKAVSDDEPAAQANTTTGTKPTDGKTSGQPFPTDINVGHYRIPALMTVGDNLVAAADARWGAYTAPDDCANIDTIVSRSSDKGASWNYTFANYIADYKNERDFKAATFIDPALAYNSKNDTLYMIVDLFPGQNGSQNCSMAAQKGTGFDSNGNLLLKEKASASSYDYYLKNGKIYKVSDNTAVSGYTVDAYFNLSKNGTVLGNLFTYSTEYFQPLMTSYLYLTKSTNGGATWSEPTLLNLKNTTEQDYLISPGRGMVTSDETIVFPCYTYSGSKASIIYSKDKGETWKRSQDANFTSSEGDLVELEDGTLRYFCRHSDNTSNLRYVDITKSGDGYSFGSAQTVSGVSVHSDCNLSAISYSKKIDGKQAILVSCPTSGRTTGKIFTFTVESDKALKKVAEYSVNGNNAFSYSSMTELSDGSIGILYENGDSGNITYANPGISTVASGVTFGDSTGGSDDTDEKTTKDITLYVGQTTTVTDKSGNYESEYNKGNLNENIATVTVEGKTVVGGTTTELTKVTSVTSGSQYYISDGNGNYMKLSDGTLSNVTDISEATQFTVSSSGSYYKIKAEQYYLSLSNKALDVTKTDSNNLFFAPEIYTKSSGTSYYLNCVSGSWQLTTGGSASGALYTATEKETEPVNATEITITGIAVGNTSVTVGKTIYNIEVIEAPDLVNMDTTPFICGAGQGKGSKLTGLVITEGTDYQINLNNGYSGAVWSSEDTSIVTVTNGKVTGVKEGETTVTATINGVAYTIPVTVLAGPTGSSTSTIDVYNSQVTNCTAYYSLDSGDLVEFPEGTQMYVQYTKGTKLICFFATPNTGYALTFINGVNGQYFHQVRNDEGTGYAYTGSGNSHTYDSTQDYTNSYDYFHDQLFTHVVNNSYAATADQAHTLLNYAVEKKCDGGFFYSKSSSGGDITDTTAFIAEKLPTVEKSVSKVNDADYEEGITEIKVGDTITFDVAITQYAPEGIYPSGKGSAADITYTNEKLTDNLSGATFENKAQQTTPTLSDKAVSSDTVTTYPVTYKVTQEDLDTKITNTVDLTYTYKSTYSKGSFSAEAKAEAAVSVLTGTPDDIVVDFGLSVTVDCGKITSYDFESGNASYGDISVSGKTATYSPNQTLKGVDTVTLTNSKGAEYKFKVYPATTVYYEEGFASYSDDWTTGSKGTGNQATSAVGSQANYGYDSKYAKEGNASNGTQATSSTNGANATFEFTGTGIETYANCSSAEGAATVQIRNAAGRMVKLASVDTTAKGTYGNTVSSGAYNTPIVSVNGLAHGKYTEKVYVAKGTVNLDGFRVYGTLSDEATNAAYKKDLEDNPSYFEMRDAVLTALNVNNGEDSVAVYAQVYEKTDGQIDGAIVLSNSSVQGDSNTADTLLQEGPKNELYLANGQSLTFKITTDRAVQIGLKAPSGATSYTITGKEGNQTISSSTDMFYSVKEKGTTSEEQTITITNKGENVLSVTKLKVCDDPDATFGELTEEDIKDAMISLGVIEPEAAYEDAALKLTVNDAKGNALATTTLTANGIAGESHTFAADEIEAAVKRMELPEGYALDAAEYTDIAVAYGESDTAAFTASEQVAEPEPDAPQSAFEKVVQKIVNTVNKVVNFFGKIFGWR